MSSNGKKAADSVLYGAAGGSQWSVDREPATTPLNQTTSLASNVSTLPNPQRGTHSGLGGNVPGEPSSATLSRLTAAWC